jgi:hypothetical protein
MQSSMVVCSCDLAGLPSTMRTDNGLCTVVNCECNVLGSIILLNKCKMYDQNVCECTAGHVHSNALCFSVDNM